MHALVFDNNVLVVHDYHRSYFEYHANVFYNLNTMLPDQLTDGIHVIDDHYRIIPVVSAGILPHNDKIQYLSGPHYTVVDNRVILEYNVETKPINQIKNELKNKIAKDRYEKEEAGFSLPNGVVMKTDQISQAKISGAYNFMQLKNNAEIDWKAENGWVKLKKADIDAAARAVAEYVQACFSKEKELSDLIDACTTPEELDALDLTFIL